MENLNYTLTFATTGLLCDGHNYTDLDEARDVAFDFSDEAGGAVLITEHFGASSHLVEVVEVG
jgi:hypothetical protein